MITNEVRYYEYFDKKRACNAVKAITTYADKSISAVAYCSPEELAFDFEKGKQLAYARLELKIHKKRIQSLRQKEANCNDTIMRLCELIDHFKKKRSRVSEAASKCLIDYDAAKNRLKELIEQLN